LTYEHRKPLPIGCHRRFPGYDFNAALPRGTIREGSVHGKLTPAVIHVSSKWATAMKRLHLAPAPKSAGDSVKRET